MQTIIKKYLDIKERFEGELYSGMGFSAFALLFSIISVSKSSEHYQSVARFLYVYSVWTILVITAIAIFLWLRGNFYQASEKEDYDVFSIKAFIGLYLFASVVIFILTYSVINLVELLEYVFKLYP